MAKQEPEKRANFIEYAKEANKGVKELWELLELTDDESESDILDGINNPIIAPSTIAADGTNEDYQDDLSKGLGRLISIDFSDSNHMISDGIAVSDRVYRYWRTAKPMNQGDTPHAVAYAGQQLLLAAPVANLPYKTPEALYAECQKIDEWKDKKHEGTSMRALMKVLQREGYIKQYSWAYDVDDVCNYVLEKGPVLLGINWYASMFYPDAITGFLTVRGSSARRSGNCILVKGCNKKKLCPDGSLGALRIVGNWGTDWADNGYAWISFKDATKLLADWGEVVAVDELKFGAEAEG